MDNITDVPTIARDLALIKVSATGDARTQVMQLVDVYRARIVDVSPESLVIETTGTEDKIDSLLEVLRPYGVVEMVRTGRVEMARGEHVAGPARRSCDSASDWTTQPRICVVTFPCSDCRFQSAGCTVSLNLNSEL